MWVTLFPKKAGKTSLYSEILPSTIGSSGVYMAIVGSCVNRNDAWAKVRGTAKFAGDIKMPGMAEVAVVRSPYAHAKIKGLDTSRALAMEGVLNIVTAADIPGKNLIPLVFNDMPALAKDHVRYHGEAVALVVADTREHAVAASKQVNVEYEVLPALTDPLESIKKDAPRLYGQDNIFRRWIVNKGDAARALQDAAVVIRGTYRTPYQEHLYLETQGIVANWSPEGVIEVRGAMQCPFYVRDAVAAVLGLDLSSVRVIQATTGGGFGGKEDVPSTIAAHAALASRMTGRPAKLVFRRDEDILVTSKRHPAVIEYESGFDSTGRLLAVRARYILNAGAYATLSPIVLWRGAMHAAGPYRVPNVDIEALAVATNMVPCGAFRGFGEPQIHFAFESQMDIAAARLDMDPMEIRRKNALEAGDKAPMGQVLGRDVGLTEALDKVEKQSGWHEKFRRPQEKSGILRRGIGASAVYYGVGLGAGGHVLDRAGAFVQVMYDGSAVFAVGTVEMGQGMISEVSQLIAQELGVPIEKIRAMPPDTHILPDSGPTVASRTTVMTGNAVLNACAPIKKQLLEAAAGLLGCPVEELVVRTGEIAGKTGVVPLSDVLSRCFTERRDLAATGWFKSPKTTWDEKAGRGSPYMTYAWAANVIEVTVDMETGVVKPIEIWAAHDVGKAINPQQVRGQIIGGSLQGIGYGLMEEILHRDGKMVNNRLSQYIIPTVEDAPKINAIIVESNFEQGPHGAKGFGEQPLIGIAPALANAVYNATGKRIMELPLTPERVMAAIKEAENED